MKKNIEIFFLCLSALVLLPSCQSDEEESPETLPEQTADTLMSNTQSIISALAPSDMAAMLIDNSALTFNKYLVNSVSNSEKYNTNAKKALNIGVYTADLSYVCFFEQNQMAYDYFEVIDLMTNDLGVINPIEKRHLEIIQKSRPDKETMMKIINETFMKTEAYLKENNRGRLVDIILVGGWIETQYIALQLSEALHDSNKDLCEGILAQKLTLELMLKSLENMRKDDKVLSPLKKDLDAIYQVYNTFDEEQETVDFHRLSNLITQIRKKYVS